jgi:hypothetical protein
MLRNRIAAAALVTTLLVGVRADVVRAGDPAPAPASNFAQQVVATLQMGPGIQSNQVILFPLYLDQKPEEPAVQASTTGAIVTFSEPEKPRKRDNVEIFNARTTAVFVAGGTVLEGGKRDRMLVADHVIPAGSTIEVEALPASTARGIRKEAKPFRAITPLAPPYLREEADSSGARSLAPRFVSHFLEFRNDGDLRESLAAIAETDKLEEYCLVCQRAMASWPNAIKGATVVGGIAVVRGRVQSLELFGSPKLLADYFEPILKSLAFPAAAVELRAQKAGIPIPGHDDPAKTLEKATAAAKELFDRLKIATYAIEKGVEGDSTEAYALALGEGIRGRAVGFGDRKSVV